jgi:myo-inositol catabolism protein IolC
MTIYVLPFDHRGSFQAKMFGWPGSLTAAQIAEIAATKQVIYDGFKAALETGVPERKAGILVDERFGASILRDATAHGYTLPVRRRRVVRKSSTLSTARNSPNTLRPSSRLSARSWFAITPRAIEL